LKNLPVELDKTYEDAMERIQKQPEEESKLAMRLLLWITHTLRPLKVGEIQHAMAVMDFEPDQTLLNQEDLPDEALLITVCGGIAAIDHESRVLRLVHYTTQEYFEKHRAETFPDAQLNISRSCIRYLSIKSFMEGPCSTDTEMENRIETYELLDYASHNWGNHAREVTGNTIEELQQCALGFLGNSRKVSSAAQVMLLPEYRYRGYSQGMPLNLSGTHLCAYFGLWSIMSRLLEKEADLESKDSYGQTPLLWAAENGHKAVVKLLLEKGAEVESKDRNDQTPLL
jgi:ankyrin repeat protein